ncbi:MAG: MAPEG family protein [Pseudomonadota bacterium]
MTHDLWILFWAGLLGLVHLSVASFAFKAQVGNAYSVGARDENIQPTGIAARLQRAQWNFLETFPVFAALVLIAHVSGEAGYWSLLGGRIYLAGRILFLPLYALGIPWLRTFSWNIATAGLVMVGAEILV